MLIIGKAPVVIIACLVSAVIATVLGYVDQPLYQAEPALCCDGWLHCGFIVDRPADRRDDGDIRPAGRLGAHPLETSHPGSNSDWMDGVYDLRVCGLSLDAVTPA